MTRPAAHPRPATGETAATPDNAPPTSSKVSAGLAALACAACCAIPLLIAAGILTGAGAAILQKTLIAVAGVLAAAAAGLWWLHQRRTARRTAPAGQAGRAASCGCASNCAC